MINIIKVKNRTEGNLKAHALLKKIIDSETLLALSGGTSPDYQKMIVKPADILPGAICVVDDRFAEPFHKNSNELLLKKEGVFDFAKRQNLELHKILSGKGFLETEKDYDKVIIRLFKKFKKKVAVMGIGANLHTAGVFPYSAAAKSPDFVVAETVEDRFPRRITITLRALGEFQYFVILAYGRQKRKALKIMLNERENDMQKYPVIFYRKAFAKSYLITDQKL